MGCLSLSKGNAGRASGERALLTAAMLTVDSNVSELSGVGPEKTRLLAKLGIETVEDLLLHAPRKYEDRRRFASMGEIKEGDAVTVCGEVITLGIKSFRGRGKSLFELVLEDDGGRLFCRWWNAPYMKGQFKKGDQVLVNGRVKPGRPLTMDHPDIEILGTDADQEMHMKRIVPFYPLTEGIAQKWIRKLVWDALHVVEVSHEYDWDANVEKGRFLTHEEAIQELHFPSALERTSDARQRLAFEELMQLQMNLRERRVRLAQLGAAPEIRGDDRLIKLFLKGLPFSLTKSQTEVLKEIRLDMESKVPMRRLLQGDVGSGKTVVAACASLMTLECGKSVALMAPTEILANQHFDTLTRWLEPSGIEVKLFTGSRRSEAEDAQVKLIGGGAAGCPPIYVGTHALLESSVEVEELGLVIIDEQHKFGVSQREKLVRKGRYPHLLVMTATPIPRTLGLTLYGDLDVSTINELPAGRGEVKTYVRGRDRLAKVLKFVKGKLEEGRQAYFVYPRVEENEQDDVKAVTGQLEVIEKALAPHSCGLLHGRMKGEEKEEIMSAFVAGELKALVATTVIEVGVDVSNATVMVVEDAERFGLAQLHQLRGRIGRGGHEGWMILIAQVKTEEAEKRLEIMTRTTDGFEIAEEDMRLRGPGELLGKSQSGLPAFRFADLSKDRRIIELARSVAKATVG